MTTKAKPVTMRPYKSKPATEQPKSFPVRLQIVFTVDGQPVGTAAGETALTPPANGEPVVITFPLDARQLATLLDQALGPRTPSVVKRIWTPRQD